jgi:hypothetical protein
MHAVIGACSRFGNPVIEVESGRLESARTGSRLG